VSNTSRDVEVFSGMRIDVVWGSAEGRTELGAFDRALAGAGVHDYNLVRLSSVVPQGATVVEAGRVDREHPVGTPVGVVLADRTADEPGATVAAGVGWALAEEGGVFMEAGGDSVEACRASIEASLADARDRRDWDWQLDCETVVRSQTVEETAAVVVGAVYGPLAHRWE